MQEYTIIFMGKSGCGKGTQIKKLVELLNQKGENSIELLEAGQDLRDFINSETYSSKLARSNNENGKLQPAFLAVWVWVNKMIQTYSGQKVLIFDGAPRQLNEAYILDEMFDFYNRQNRFIIHINVSDVWARDRLKERGRNDDIQKESVDRRLTWFKENAPDILSFFEQTGKYKVCTIHGEQDIDKVFKDIIGAINV